jgi:hypothetical protein
VLRHRVDQRRHALLDLRDRPLKRRLEIVGGLDGTFGSAVDAVTEGRMTVVLAVLSLAPLVTLWAILVRGWMG